MRKDTSKPDRRVSPAIPAILLTTILGVGATACGSSEGGGSSSKAANNQPANPASNSEGSGSNSTTTTEQSSNPEQPLTVTNETVSNIPGLLSLVSNTVNVPVEQLQTTTLAGSMIDVQIAGEYNEDPGTDELVSITVTPISSLPGPNPFPGWLSQAQSGSNPNLFRMAGDVNGNQAVWASNTTLATEFDGYLLEVQVENQGTAGYELPSNIDNAVQIAALFENNATT